MKVNQITTFVVTPESGKVFKRSEMVSNPEDESKQVEQVSYAVSVNLAAQSESDAREIVSAMYTQVDISEKQEYDALHAASETI